MKRFSLVPVGLLFLTELLNMLFPSFSKLTFEQIIIL